MGTGLLQSELAMSLMAGVICTSSVGAVSASVGVGERVVFGSPIPEMLPACATITGSPNRRLVLNCAGLVYGARVTGFGELQGRLFGSVGVWVLAFGYFAMNSPSFASAGCSSPLLSATPSTDCIRAMNSALRRS